MVTKGMTNILASLGLLLGVYVLAPTLVAASVIRLVFGWHKSRKYVGFALLFAIPQSLLIILGGNVESSLLRDGAALYIALGATIVAAVFWGMATFGAATRYFRVEAIIASVITIVFLGAVNWTVA